MATLRAILENIVVHYLDEAKGNYKEEQSRFSVQGLRFVLDEVLYLVSLSIIYVDGLIIA